MLTDYMVTCPHAGCHWTGSLLPLGSRDAWRTAVPPDHTILFECPCCHSRWTAHLIGDDLEHAHQEELAGSSA